MVCMAEANLSWVCKHLFSVKCLTYWFRAQMNTWSMFVSLFGSLVLFCLADCLLGLSGLDLVCWHVTIHDWLADLCLPSTMCPGAPLQATLSLHPCHNFNGAAQDHTTTSAGGWLRAKRCLPLQWSVMILSKCCNWSFSAWSHEMDNWNTLSIQKCTN